MSDQKHEAVARAICKAHGNEPDAVFGGMFGKSAKPAWTGYLKQAAAAIAAYEAVTPCQCEALRAENERLKRIAVEVVNEAREQIAAATDRDT